MKRIYLMLVAFFATSVVVWALPLSDFTWQPPTLYEDGTVIPVEDILSYKLYCSSTSGGPYNTQWDLGANITDVVGLDVRACVQSTPGTYYFVATAISTTYALESGFSNEVSKVYTFVDLGRTPNPPDLLQVL